jgi:PAS domain S-box-containing protein
MNQRRSMSLAVVFGAATAYELVFASLHQMAGDVVAVFTVIPVAVAGWLLGARAGLVAGLLGSSLNIMNFTLVGQIGWEVVLGRWPAVLASLAVGVMAGWGGERAACATRESREASHERDRFFDLSMDLLCIAGTDGCFKRLNPAWERALGFSREELCSKPFIEFIHPDDRSRTQDVMEKLSRGEPAINFENRYRCRDGSYRWLTWNTPAPEQDPPMFYAAARDITERKRIEEELRESEERYRLLTDATFDGIAIHDQGIMIEASSGLERMFGYGPGELIGKHVLDLVADESREMVIANMRQGAQGPYESVGRRKDGSIFYGEVVVKPYRYKGRDVRLVAGRDITERKQMEQALWQANDELEQRVAQRTKELVAANDALCLARAWQRDLIEAIPGIVWECNVRTWRFSFVNHQAELVLGYPVQRWLDEPDFWQTHIHQDDRDWVIEYCLASLRDTRKYSFEYRMIAADGRTVWLQDIVTVETDEQGPAILRGIMLDITERKQAEEALRKSEEQLRKVLEEREQLSQDLHDNIIQSIYAIGMSLEECRYLVQEDRQAADKKLEHAVACLNRVISDVRMYIVWDKHDEISGQQFCAKLAELAVTMESVQGIHFSLDLAVEAARRLTPLGAFHILHIVQEAMSNSLRHSKSRSGHVSLQMEGGRIRLEVSDDGIGFNLEGASGQGHGLQNMVARAHKLGANFQIISKPGSGAQILVELPLEDQHARASS